MAKKQFYYRIFPTGLNGVYRVSKLDEDYDPVETYQTSISDMTVLERGRKCTCPSWKQPCKHVKMVKRFVAEGEPQNTVLNSLTDEFEEFLFDL